MKKAVIVGYSGQDGTLLSKLLLEKKYQLIGVNRDSVQCSDDMNLNKIDICNKEDVFNLIERVKPDEVYYLAAFHNSSEDKLLDNVTLFKKSNEVNVLGFINFLEAIRLFSLKTKIFYASSSHIFKGTESDIQNENTPINPNCIYGITKASGLFASRYYRKNYSIFTSTGILYNHESSLRHEKFVSKKIIKGALNIKDKKQDKLKLGDLSAEIDWGYAPDYVEAMYKILNTEKADDFIIATGEKHTIQEFVELVFGYLGLDWKMYVEEAHSIVKTTNKSLVGDYKKLVSVTGWKPSANFKQMIGILLKEEGVVF